MSGTDPGRALFSPLKKKGIDICTLIKALTACKLSGSFSINDVLNTAILELKGGVG